MSGTTAKQVQELRELALVNQAGEPIAVIAEALLDVIRYLDQQEEYQQEQTERM